jgi:hypothetical protein
MDETLDEKFTPMLERITEMFLEYGIKNLNMDDISRKLGISKKTLYRFVNKESLVAKIFEYENYKGKLFFDSLAEKPLNAIEKLFEVSIHVHQRMKHFNPMLVFELKKYYESLFDNHMAEICSFLQTKMRLNLEQGISEGLYRSDVNIDPAVTLYVNSLVEMHNMGFAKVNNVSIEQVFEVLFEHHIRAISTSEGIAYFEKRKKEIIDSRKANKN